MEAEECGIAVHDLSCLATGIERVDTALGSKSINSCFVSVITKEPVSSLPPTVNTRKAR